MNHGNELLLEHERNGSKVKVTARWRGDAGYMPVLDRANAEHRKRFVKALAEKLPQVDRKAIDGELLRIADSITEPAKPTADSGPVELDVSRIVRPELFITPEVSGLTVPVVQLVDGKP